VEKHKRKDIVNNIPAGHQGVRGVFKKKKKKKKKREGGLV